MFMLGCGEMGWVGASMSISLSRGMSCGVKFGVDMHVSSMSLMSGCVLCCFPGNIYFNDPIMGRSAWIIGKGAKP